MLGPSAAEAVKLLLGSAACSSQGPAAVEPPEYTADQLRDADPYVMAPSKLTDRVPVANRGGGSKPALRGSELAACTPAEIAQLEREDIRLQKELQRRDLEQLYQEHAALVGEQELGERKRIQDGLTQQLSHEAQDARR
eukprot:RCo021129